MTSSFPSVQIAPNFQRPANKIHKYLSPRCFTTSSCTQPHITPGFQECVSIQKKPLPALTNLKASLYQKACRLPRLTRPCWPDWFLAVVNWYHEYRDLKGWGYWGQSPCSVPLFSGCPHAKRNQQGLLTAFGSEQVQLGWVRSPLRRIQCHLSHLSIVLLIWWGCWVFGSRRPIGEFGEWGHSLVGERGKR